MAQHPAAATPIPFTPYQKLVVAILAFLQFTIVLDFIILSPLGAMMMPALGISPSQFGLLVSIYAFSAGTAGFLTAGFADRFDRKRLLLFFYAGFVLGTLLCGIAPSYRFLLGARLVTGLFGGVVGSISLAICADLFAYEARGRVMGLIQTSFAASQVLGIPVGLYLSNHWGWHMPFLMIVAVGAAVGVVIWMRLQPIDAHLRLQGVKTSRNPFGHLMETVSNPRYLMAFATTALLTTGGFMLMPFGSAFSVHNLGIPLDDLPAVYLVTGICAIFIGPIVGRLADRHGKLPVFACGTVLSIGMVLIYTHLGVTPLWLVMLINVVMFMGIFSRMIPFQALMSAIPSPASRGAFMSVSSSLQQVSGGLAALVAGLIVVEGAGGRLEHFERIGYVVSGAAVVTMLLMVRIQRQLRRD